MKKKINPNTIGDHYETNYLLSEKDLLNQQYAVRKVKKLGTHIEFTEKIESIKTTVV